MIPAITVDSSSEVPVLGSYCNSGVPSLSTAANRTTSGCTEVAVLK